MVWFFTPCNNSYIIYMGKDKEENEYLIEYGLPTDVWFHVDNLSSAHVYLRLKEGEDWKEIPEDVLIDCCQLVKANSIEGSKRTNVGIVYTPWSNLHKTQAMATGQVGFKKNKLVKKTMVEKRINAIVNRLNKTKRWEEPDLRAEREAYDARQEKLARIEKQKAKEAAKEAAKKEREEALVRSYASLKDESLMRTNQDLSEMTVEDYEDDFM